MDKRIVFSILVVAMLFACKKDETCSGVAMCNDRAVFVGTWHWYQTVVREWFDIGPDMTHYYTPQTEGFDYYFTISEDGVFNSYRNGVLEQNFILSNVQFEYNGSNANVLVLNADCSNTTVISLEDSYLNSSSDSIRVVEYPLNFYDEENQRESIRNYFVKE